MGKDLAFMAEKELNEDFLDNVVGGLAFNNSGYKNTIKKNQLGTEDPDDSNPNGDKNPYMTKGKKKKTTKA